MAEEKGFEPSRPVGRYLSRVVRLSSFAALPLAVGTGFEPATPFGATHFECVYRANEDPTN